MSKKEKDLENIVVPAAEGTNEGTNEGTTGDKENSNNKGKDKDKDKDKGELKPPVVLPGLGGLSLDKDESKE